MKDSDRKKPSRPLDLFKKPHGKPEKGQKTEKVGREKKGSTNKREKGNEINKKESYDFDFDALKGSENTN